MTRLLLALLVGCTPYQLHHGNRIMTATAIGVTACDWGQTAWAQTQGSHFLENNPLLGMHPSQASIALYFGTALAAIAVGAHYLPDWAVPILAGTVTVFETRTIYDNSIGIPYAHVPITCGIQGRAASAP